MGRHYEYSKSDGANAVPAIMTLLQTESRFLGDIYLISEYADSAPALHPFSTAKINPHKFQVLCPQRCGLFQLDPHVFWQTLLQVRYGEFRHAASIQL